MPFGHGKSGKLFVNGENLSGYLTSVTVARTADSHDRTVLGGDSHAFTTGLTDATLSGEGLASFDEDELDEILEPVLGAEALCSFYPNGDAAGARGKGLDCDATSYEIDSPVDGLSTFALEAQSSVGSEAVKSHRAHGTVTASEDGSAVDNAASSADGGVAYLHVTSVDGTTPTLDAKIQDSADDTTYVDLVAFSQATAKGAQRVEVAGTVDRYTRSVLTVGGTAPSFGVQVGFGRK